MSDHAQETTVEIVPFWQTWFRLVWILILLIVSSFYLYLVHLHGVGDALMVLLMALFLCFVTYYIVYLLLASLIIGGVSFWLLSRYPQQFKRIEKLVFIAIAMVWGLGILGFAFEVIPYHVLQRTYF